MSVRFRNLRSFNRDLEKFGKVTVPAQSLKLQKRIALDLLRRIVFRTPVDTGRARGNWQTALGASSRSEIDRLDTSGGTSVSVGSAVIAGARPYGVITIFNNVDYIEYLEGGSSQQAPIGMVAVSLAEVEAQFR